MNWTTQEQHAEIIGHLCPMGFIVVRANDTEVVFRVPCGASIDDAYDAADDSELQAYPKEVKQGRNTDLLYLRVELFPEPPHPDDGYNEFPKGEFAFIG